MKRFYVHHVRNVFAIAVVLGLGYAAYLVNPGSFLASKAEAGASENVSGFAWSETIGWISLNSTSDGSAISYGVDVNPLTGIGTFTGNAWSDTIGWISFAPADLSICPAASVAQVDWTTGNVTGWARALGGSATSGWDGCIKFSDDSVAVWNGKGVKISLTDGKFSGYAYGSGVVGWIDFSPLLNGTTPFATPAEVQGVAQCTAATINAGYGTWNACDATASCQTGGGVTQSGLTGTQSGTCNNGDSGTAYQSCTATTTDCSAANSSTVYIIGDGICNTGAGENITNSPVDCKPKTKFWQF